MTEQIEDDFWAEERARDTAARGRQADPGACGTCRDAVAAGGQVKHDECAQRATLLPAPDAPAWELITGLSEEELAALPARFHVPAFVESSTPKAWVCAVCWGDGWSTQWPCKTATEQGLRVFTAEDYAETRERRQAAEVEQLRARVTELEAERAKYVGVEPTIAEEMAYLSRCLDAVHEACDRAVRQATRWEQPLPIPGWVDTVRAAADGATEPLGTRPALPWAHLMDDGDLHEFLGDLVSAAMGRWQSDPEVPDRDVLAAIEKACADWRTPGQGLRSDEAERSEGR
jgi:hypothetical protein